ncbi:hypothetical protein K437DRAFT_268008 [Tilletiaria anomala UBC 951]|uniref:Uncharacterized protein n=1 Tax=Tilletiaria anomala (strain ATCC 24038 / CBS 436.72 / UBC 951) TaxID=1037660 RepID=A0A066W7P5_TILAU|nr:uncharacterized protein K437DRAFT_268008 [Tilletiaria anomala UBC 951]KDN46785.1 hypothetical protein K437DRAFT_268008 [Tilletiaria anomala UBC 951]
MVLHSLSSTQLAGGSTHFIDALKSGQVGYISITVSVYLTATVLFSVNTVYATYFLPFIPAVICIAVQLLMLSDHASSQNQHVPLSIRPLSASMKRRQAPGSFDLNESARDRPFSTNGFEMVNTAPFLPHSYNTRLADPEDPGLQRRLTIDSIKSAAWRSRPWTRDRRQSRRASSPLRPVSFLETQISPDMLRPPPMLHESYNGSPASEPSMAPALRIMNGTPTPRGSLQMEQLECDANEKRRQQQERRASSATLLNHNSIWDSNARPASFHATSGTRSENRASVVQGDLIPEHPSYRFRSLSSGSLSVEPAGMTSTGTRPTVLHKYPLPTLTSASRNSMRQSDEDWETAGEASDTPDGTMDDGPLAFPTGSNGSGAAHGHNRGSSDDAIAAIQEWKQENTLELETAENSSLGLSLNQKASASSSTCKDDGIASNGQPLQSRRASISCAAKCQEPPPPHSSSTAYPQSDGVVALPSAQHGSLPESTFLSCPRQSQQQHSVLAPVPTWRNQFLEAHRSPDQEQVYRYPRFENRVQAASAPTTAMPRPMYYHHPMPLLHAHHAEYGAATGATAPILAPTPNSLDGADERRHQHSALDVQGPGHVRHESARGPLNDIRCWQETILTVD